MGIIYKWTNIINGKSYIGQTAYPEKRYYQHLLVNDNTPFHNALRKYGVDSFTYQVLEDDIDDEKLDEREIYWINYFNTYQDGYNLTIGGNSTRGFKFSYEQIKHLSDAHLGQIPWNKGKIMNDEYRKKASEGMKGNHNKMGYICTDEQRKRIGDSHKGIQSSKRQPVLMLEKNTNDIIKSFDSITKGSNYLNKTTNSGIVQCLSGKLKTAYGYKWKKQ